MNNIDDRPFSNGQTVISTNGIYENTAEIIGNTGSHRDNFQPRLDKSQRPVLNFTVCTERVINNDGMKEKTWHSVVVFGGAAERAGKMLRKGRLVRVKGIMIRTMYEREVTTVTGHKVVISEPAARLLATNIDFFGNNFDCNYGVKRQQNQQTHSNNNGNQAQHYQQTRQRDDHSENTTWRPVTSQQDAPHHDEYDVPPTGFNEF